MRLLEQGPESQSTSWICWGGVSSVMAPPIFLRTVCVPSGHKVIGIKAHCPFDGIYANVRMACHNGLMQALGIDPRADSCFLLRLPTNPHNSADAHLKLLLATSRARTSDLHTILFSEVSIAWAFHPMVSPMTIGR